MVWEPGSLVVGGHVGAVLGVGWEDLAKVRGGKFQQVLGDELLQAPGERSEAFEQSRAVRFEDAAEICAEVVLGCGDGDAAGLADLLGEVGGQG
ncbi:hypothetical protein C9J60_24710 [Streptomyces sp. A244]|uniref:hypothetical protein n=1 Tax=Streptomyces TaxID=1883 RepID=UPI000D1B88DE|nr:hypothetical protein [Streptomyces sp. A244]PTH86333.1 hypothetical protein C9J60_24710 [Streptomyces sp. A244]